MAEPLEYGCFANVDYRVAERSQESHDYIQTAKAVSKHPHYKGSDVPICKSRPILLIHAEKYSLQIHTGVCKMGVSALY